MSPRPGPHRKFESIPLQIFLRDIEGLVQTGKEAKTVLSSGEVLVDAKTRKDFAYPVGLYDTVSIPKIKKNWRIVVFKNGLKPVEISQEEAGKKICRIKGKTVIKGKKVQLSLHDGRTIIVDKDVYKTGDSVLISLPQMKVLEHVKLEKGVTGVVITGSDRGKMGIVENIINTASKEPATVTFKMSDGEKLSVIKDRFFVVGQDKPLVTVGE